MKRLLPLLLIALVASLLFLPQFLTKVNVVCKNQYGPCSLDVQPAGLVAAKKEIKNKLKNDPLVLDYSTQFKLPNTLEVNLLIKKPAFAFQNKATEKIYLVSENGQILSEREDTSLPLLIQDGESVNLPALKLLNGVFTMYQVTSGEIKDGSLTVELPGAVTVLFPLDGDSEVLLGALRLIYTRVQGDEEKKYSEIDLRFKNPVLR